MVPAFRRHDMVSVAAAIAVASAVTGVTEASPDVLEFVTEGVQCDHQRSVGHEAALAAVAVRTDEVVELAVSVLVVCLLGLYGAGVYVGHVPCLVRHRI